MKIIFFIAIHAPNESFEASGSQYVRTPRIPVETPAHTTIEDVPFVPVCNHTLLTPLQSHRTGHNRTPAVPEAVPEASAPKTPPKLLVVPLPLLVQSTPAATPANVPSVP